MLADIQSTMNFIYHGISMRCGDIFSFCFLTGVNLPDMRGSEGGRIWEQYLRAEHTFMISGTMSYYLLLV